MSFTQMVTLTLLDTLDDYTTKHMQDEYLTLTVSDDVLSIKEYEYTHIFSVSDASKSADLTSISDTEPQSFTEAKEEIVELITRWSLEDEPVEPPFPPTPEPETPIPF